MTEVRFHGRGGQGVVSAASLIADAAVSEGKYVQAFPEFGAERSGAPDRCVHPRERRADRDTLVHLNPDVVVVVDKSMAYPKSTSRDWRGTDHFICNFDGPPRRPSHEAGA